MPDHIFAVADAARLPLASQSVDLVIGSPPYTDCRRYTEAGVDMGMSRGTAAWVDWMLGVTTEALRVTRGAVIWVVAGPTRRRNYQPAAEGLLWEAHRRGILSECPVYWHRHGISGSGGDQWFRKCIETCLCFKRSPVLPWSDNLACGKPPVCKPGGKTSHRKADGARVSGRSVVVKIANPSNLLSTGAAGGGNIGDKLAHDNEAPFPESVPEFFVKSLCPPGGIVLDPFSGSGTSVAVASRLGRRGIGFDLRPSQAELGRRRLERAHAGELMGVGA